MKVYHTQDKTSWLRGPWDAEPDKAQWTDPATNLPCLIVRGPMGALCGYVGVSPDHPWFGRGYDDCQAASGDYVEVHGGLTYANHCRPGPEDSAICHVPDEGQPDNIWWLGFDCSHSGDMYGMNLPELLWDRDNPYRDFAYVQHECTQLAAQAAEVV